MSSLTPDIDVNALMRGLVHELRNPLSAILTATSLLQPGGVLDEESDMLLEVVKKESVRMNRILTEFSSFVRPPMPQIDIFDLVALVREITREMQQEETLPRQVTIHDELPKAHWVHGDSLQTSQVIRHVLTNSAESMQHQGNLRLLATQDSELPDICIDDSGTGLNDGVLEKAFQPFFSTKPAATGLGLSISRGLVRAFGGELTIENLHSTTEGHEEERLGARVRLHLPVASLANDENELDTD